MEPFILENWYRMAPKNNPRNTGYIMIYHGRSQTGNYIMEQLSQTGGTVGVFPYTRTNAEQYNWVEVPVGTLK